MCTRAHAHIRKRPHARVRACVSTRTGVRLKSIEARANSTGVRTTSRHATQTHLLVDVQKLVRHLVDNLGREAPLVLASQRLVPPRGRLRRIAFARGLRECANASAWDAARVYARVSVRSHAWRARLCTHVRHSVRPLRLLARTREPQAAHPTTH